MAQEDARSRHADRARALDVLRGLEIQYLPAHKPRHADPPEADEGEGYDDVIDDSRSNEAVEEGVVLQPTNGLQQAGAQRCRDDDHEQYVWERRRHLPGPHDDLVDLPSKVPGNEAESDADDQASGEHSDDGEDDGVLDAPKYSRKDVPSRAVGACPVLPTRRVAQGGVVLGSVLVAGDERGQRRCKYPRQVYHPDGDHRRYRNLLARQPRQGPRKMPSPATVGAVGYLSQDLERL